MGVYSENLIDLTEAEKRRGEEIIDSLATNVAMGKNAGFVAVSSVAIIVARLETLTRRMAWLEAKVGG